MTELPDRLSPTNVNSFAYLTYKDRLPVILVKIVDSLYRNKHILFEKYGEGSSDKIKFITSEVSRLRHELTTNKALTYFEDKLFGDEDIWNQSLTEEISRVNNINQMGDDKKILWFQTSFLFGENYMYRRIFDTILKSNLKNLDPFYFDKFELLKSGLDIVSFLTLYLQQCSSNVSEIGKDKLKEITEIFFKMSLWGNEADLSLAVSDNDRRLKRADPQKVVLENNNKLLVDDTDEVFKLLETASKNGTARKVTIFLDNAGSELLTDLHLVEWLLAADFTDKVVLICKAFPWYISDVTMSDFYTTLEQMDFHPTAHWLGKQIQHRLQSASLEVTDHNFVTLPYPYCVMSDVASDLYESIRESTLVIFKGDLNYRKLVADRCWSPVDCSFRCALQGFEPTNLVALRVLKCNVQVGLNHDRFQMAVTQHPDNWMISSKYAIVQALIKA